MIPQRQRNFWLEAGYPNGFDGGQFTGDVTFSHHLDIIGNYWNAIGIKVRLSKRERAGFFAAINAWIRSSEA